MKPQNTPLFSFGLRGFADSVRTGLSRMAGYCRALINTAPNRADGEGNRQGYLAYTAVTAPTGMEILKVAPIDKPSKEDVHIWFSQPSNQEVRMNPYWFYDSNSATAKQSSNILIDEVFSIPTETAITTPSAKVIRIPLAVSGLTLITNYYAGWSVYYTVDAGVTKKFAQVVSWVVFDATYWDLTCIEDVDATGLNIVAGATLILRRNSHNTLKDTGSEFNPLYSTDISTQPDVNVDASIIRLSGGMVSGVNYKAIRIEPYKSKTFFGSSPRPFTYYGTYVSDAELRALDCLTITLFGTSGTGNVFADNQTIRFAVCPVYDFGQIGNLTEYTAQYTGATATSNSFSCNLSISLGALNKNISSILLFCAVDDDDTSSSGRVNDYKFIREFSIINSDLTWLYTTGATQKYLFSFIVFSADVYAASTTYIDASGREEIPTDISYGYSHRSIVEGRHILSNVYVTSEGRADRERFFINPIGGLAGVNSGVVQYDAFPNEDGVYKIPAEQSVGTRITGLFQTKMGEVICLKDRGVLYGRPVTLEDTTLNFTWHRLSTRDGCSTLKGFTEGNDDWYYFGGYDDIYRVRGSELQKLVETGQDWKYTYQEIITPTMKESIVCWYLPTSVVKFDIGQYDSTSTNIQKSYQFSFYPYRAGVEAKHYFNNEEILVPDNGWRRDAYKTSTANSGQPVSAAFFKWVTYLQNGTPLTIELNSSAVVQGVRQWNHPTTQTPHWSDNGTAIRYHWDTGDIEFTPHDLRLNKINILRTLDTTTSGTLDFDLYRDRGASIFKTYSGMDKTRTYLPLNSMSDDPRIMYALRIRCNSNSSPEVLGSGSLLQTNAIEIWGEFMNRNKRATDTPPTTSTVTITPPQGQVNGLSEVILNETDLSFVWDVPFTETYTSLDGTTQPAYRILFDSAHPLNPTLPDATIGAEVSIVTYSLTGFTAHASMDNVLFKFKTERIPKE